MYCCMSFWLWFLVSGFWFLVLRGINLTEEEARVGRVSDQHQTGGSSGLGILNAVPAEAVNTGDHDGGSLHIMR